VNDFSELIPPAARERIEKTKAFINPPYLSRLSSASGFINTGDKRHLPKDGRIRGETGAIFEMIGENFKVFA